MSRFLILHIPELRLQGSFAGCTDGPSDETVQHSEARVLIVSPSGMVGGDHGLIDISF